VKVIGFGGSNGVEYIVTMSKGEMMRVLGETYLPDEKLPKTGSDVKLSQSWDVVTYMRDRPQRLYALRDSVQAIEKAVEKAIEDISSPLIIHG
jgi:hypothetical protein